MPDTNVFEMPRPARKPSPAMGTGFRLPGTQASITPAPRPSRGSVLTELIEIDKLYPTDKDQASDLIAALSDLADAIRQLEDARIAAKNKEGITADRSWQRFESLLPRLFTFRKIGDGYGAIINALHFACINQHGLPLTFDQLTTVWRIIKQLRNAPVIPFEEALGRVQELEDCGLKIYPVTISEMTEEAQDSADD